MLTKKLLFIAIAGLLTAHCGSDISRPNYEDPKKCGSSGNFCTPPTVAGPDGTSDAGHETCKVVGDKCECFCQPTPSVSH